MRSGAAARPALHLRCVLVTTGGGCGFGRPLFRRKGKPAVEVVEDGFDGWPQLVGDLLLALALAGAASGLRRVPDLPSGVAARGAVVIP
jgi:hypothetical protein